MSKIFLCFSFTVCCILLSAIISADVSITGEGKNLSISNGKTKISTIVKDAGVTGFKLFSLEGGKEIEVAPIELTSSDKWIARTIESGKDNDRVWFVLKDIDTRGTDGTPEFGKDSFVKVQLDKDNPFPLIEFHLNVQSFDLNKWNSAWQNKCPIYFLRCTLNEAQCFYQGGELYPSPTYDPYPITLGNMKASWADNWSYGPAIGAHPVPAMGLWAPQIKKFVAYEFQHARATDKSDKYIGNSYCAGLPDHPKQFFTLIYPYAASWANARYPENPVTIGTHFRIIYNLDIPSWEDPNMFVMNYTHKTYRDILPPVPKMNDLSWISRGYDWFGQLLYSDIKGTKSYPKSLGNWPRLFSRWDECEKQFFKPGTIQLHGHEVSIGYQYSFLVGDKVNQKLLKEQVEYLIPKAIKKVYDGEECYVWEHPLEGSFSDAFRGEAATSTQNMFNWAIADGMLWLYKSEKDEKLLPYIDGMVRWSRHYLYDRAGMADLPQSVFSMGAENGGNFLLDYYYTFRDDPQRKELAQEAFRLARVIVYRNIYSYTDDPDETDWLDPTFLFQAVNASYWLGMVTWGEMGRIPMMCTSLYVDTGDPIFKYIVRGSLERFPFGTCNAKGGFYENFDIFGMWHKGQGSGGWGSANFRRYAEPIADSVMRVVVGSKACIAFDKGTYAVDAVDYRYEPEGNFRFKVVVDKTLPYAPQDTFCIIATCPRRDLKGKKVSINGSQLTDDKYIISTCGEDVVVRSVKDGDVVTVGELAKGEPFKIEEPKMRTIPKEKTIDVDGFKILNLYPYANVVIDNVWRPENKSADNWAGFFCGQQFFQSIPYYIMDPILNGGKAAAGSDREIIIPVDEDAKAIFMVVSPEGKFGKIGEYEIEFSDGKKEMVELRGGTEVRRGVKYLKKSWQHNLYCYFLPEYRRLRSIRIPRGVLVFSIALLSKDTQRTINAVGSLKDFVEEKIAIERNQGYQVPEDKSRVDWAWWNKDWHYRFLLEIGAGECDRLDHIGRIKEDFGLVLAQIGISDAFDPNSVRIVEYEPSGKMGKQISVQFNPGYAVDKGELLFIVPGKFKAKEKKYFYVYFDTVKNPKKSERPGISCSINNGMVSINTGNKGMRFEFSLTPKPGPRIEGIYFEPDINVLGPSGYVGGYGTLTAVTDGQCWYNFGASQKEDAVAQIVHNGPVSLTLRISGVEVYGTPPKSPSKKGQATWCFQFFKDDKRFDEWVDTSIKQDTGWTRKFQVRYGLNDWSNADNINEEGIKYANTGKMASLPLQDFPDRVPVLVTFTTDGNVLQVELEKMDNKGDYYSDRWRVMPAGLTSDVYVGNAKMISFNQFAAEVLTASGSAKPDLKDVQVQPYNSKEQFVPETKIAHPDDSSIGAAAPAPVKKVVDSSSGSVYIVLGTKDENAGIRRKDNSDEGKSSSAKKGDRECGVPGVNPHSEARYFYFDVDDKWAKINGIGKINITIEYFDAGAEFGLEYDSSDESVNKSSIVGAFKDAGESVSIGGTEKWRTITFKLPDARFNNGCNGADFRLQGAGEFYISKIIIGTELK